MRLPSAQRKQIDLLLIDAEWTFVQRQQRSIRYHAKQWWKRRTRKQIEVTCALVAFVGVGWGLFNFLKYESREAAKIYEGRYYEPFDAKEDAQSQAVKPSPSYPSGQVWIPKAYGQWNPVPVEGGKEVRGDSNAPAKPEVPRAPVSH